MRTNQLPRKHIGKKMTDKQEQIVEQIQKEKGYKTLLEAKHEYFENQEMYDKRQGTKIVKVPGITEEEKWAEEKAPQLAKKPKEEHKNREKKRKSMTIEEAKLGVTIVLSKTDCENIGINKTTMTRDAVDLIRQKLGLLTKAERKAEKKKGGSQ